MNINRKLIEILQKFRNFRFQLQNKYFQLPKKHLNFILIFVLISLFFATLIAGGKIYLQYKITSPVNNTSDSKIFIVNKGETVSLIAQNLEKQGLIHNDFYFLIYYKILNKSFSNSLTLKAGKYKLSPSLNIIEIAEKLSYGLTIPEDVRVMIPEGSNIFHIACLLEKKGLVSATDFINFCSSHSIYINYNNDTLELVTCQQEEEQAGEDKKGFQNCQLSYPLEGYLFPDTYLFKKGTPIDKIVSKMISNFEKKVIQKLQDSISNPEEAFSYDLTSLTVLASLLEKEVPTYYDKRIVAGIIEQRLNSGMPLQIDMTVIYAKELLAIEEILKTSTNPSSEICNLINAKKNHNPVTLKDTKLTLSYNTYQSKELPPGPINNPGFWSFKAALNSLPTNYWYYLSTKNGTTIFSTTYQDHLANKAKYLQ
jgi:UPF0755 protein